MAATRTAPSQVRVVRWRQLLIESPSEPERARSLALRATWRQIAVRHNPTTRHIANAPSQAPNTPQSTPCEPPILRSTCVGPGDFAVGIVESRALMRRSSCQGGIRSSSVVRMAW